VSDPRGEPRGETRRRAREIALQWLYQWEIGGHHLDRMFEGGHLIQLHPPERERDELAEALVRGVAENLDRIDPLIREGAEHWRIERIAVVDRLVVRIGVYELLFEPAIPHNVIINEALELARLFSTEDAVKFVNGVLDGIRKKVRPDTGGAGEAP
jgi:N utilization substance protein B